VAAAISGGDIPKAIKWNAVSPRVGITYSLDEARKTQLRGSYALFASQLGNGASGILVSCSTATRLSTDGT